MNKINSVPQKPALFPEVPPVNSLQCEIYRPEPEKSNPETLKKVTKEVNVRKVLIFIVTTLVLLILLAGFLMLFGVVSFPVISTALTVLGSCTALFFALSVVSAILVPGEDKSGNGENPKQEPKSWPEKLFYGVKRVFSTAFSVGKDVAKNVMAVANTVFKTIPQKIIAFGCDIFSRPAVRFICYILIIGALAVLGKGLINNFIKKMSVIET